MTDDLQPRMRFDGQEILNRHTLELRPSVGARRPGDRDVTKLGPFLVRMLSLVLVMAGGLLAAVSTSAGAVGPPIFVSPAPGSMVLGPLSSATIDMGEAPAGEYNLYYGYCDCYGFFLTEIDYKPTAGTTVTVPVSDTLLADQTAFLALRGYGFDVRVDFSVTMPPWVSDLDGGPSKFYPIKDDGYKDKVFFSWKSGMMDSSLVPRDLVEVLDSSGRVLLNRTSSNYSFGWDGRDANRKLVPPGLYTVRVSARNRLGHAATASRPVHIATGRVTEDETLKRAATRTTRRLTTLGCNAMNRGGDLNMWCDSGRYAEVHYEFSIPRRARNLRWKIDRKPSVDNPGTITFSGERLTPTRFRIRARVTGGEYLRMSKVQLRYRTRVLR
ncbi:hypothetical protein [Nocardioides sp. S5]|uniref:hypothetical protein n=1 Tax=Nocardioides sp. S5 TaxID=2017486 RepID=UPI001A904960|nr:hypothetical protein [Nocardioides sp. S5]